MKVQRSTKRTEAPEEEYDRVVRMVSGDYYITKTQATYDSINEAITTALEVSDTVLLYDYDVVTKPGKESWMRAEASQQWYYQLFKKVDDE